MEENVQKKRMLSGIKPSGDLTLGSYLGAVKNWAERADQYDCFYFMADLHAITVRQNPADLRRRTLEQLAQYIACGLDPEKNTLFIQSHVHQHAELAGFVNSQVTAGGISTDEFESNTMMSKKYDRFYAVGEILDIDGDCGGFNLQWAWSSSFCACDNILRNK